MTGNNVTGTNLYESDYMYMCMLFMVVMASLSAVTSFSSYIMMFLSWGICSHIAVLLKKKLV